MSVRLCVTTDYDAGFILNARPRLPDVQPGETYDEEIFPHCPIKVVEILVAEGFELFSVMTHQHGGVSPGMPVDEKLHQFGGGLPVAVGESVRLMLRNVSDHPLKAKVATIVWPTLVDVGPAQPIVRDVGPAQPRIVDTRGRFEREVASAGEAAHWSIGDIKVTNRCGFCGDEFGVRAKHVCSKAAIDPVQGTMLTTVDPSKPPPDPNVHRPVIARTLMEGPGNRTMVRGCSCGARTMSDESFARHVGVSEDAVRGMLGLYGIIDDLYRYPDDPRMRRERVQKEMIHSWLEFQMPISGPYKIQGSEVIGPNLRIHVTHVIDLLHMRHENDPRNLPTVSMMGAIGELVELLNGAYAQGQR